MVGSKLKKITPFIHESSSICLRLEDGTSEYSFTEFLEVSRKYASYLLKEGVKKNDLILFSENNSIELYAAWMGCIFIGATIVLLDKNYSESVLKLVCKKLSPNFVISKNLTLPGINKIDLISFHSLSGAIARDTEWNDIRIISFTSGTESLPKGVERNISVYLKSAKSFAANLSLEAAGQEFISYFPGYYLGGFFNGFIIPIVNKWKINIVSEFNPSEVLNFSDKIKLLKINILWLVPTIVNLLNQFYSRDNNFPGMNIIKKNLIILCGTSSLRSSTRERFFNIFGVNILDNYALSETLFISSERIGDYHNSSGKLFEDVEIKINKTGEILAKTPFLLNKYIYLDSPSKKFPPDCFFKTGDIGTFENNKLQIIDRKKDLIIRGGVNISPKYIESTITNKNLIASAVVGIEDSIRGERIVFFYCANKNIDKELISESNEKLSNTFRPDEFIKVYEMPRTSSGKIKKKDFKKTYM